MDVIRAISAVPVDRNDCPRVDVMIVASGEVGDEKAQHMNDLYIDFQRRMQEMRDIVDPPIKVRESDKAKSILAGKPGGVPIKDDELGGDSDGEQGDADLGGAPPPQAPFANERERK